MQKEATMNSQNRNSIWRQAMYYVLFGLMLSSVAFDIFGLNHVLPIVGLILQWIGFCRLQHETIWFRLCFWSTTIRTAIQICEIGLKATIWRSMVYQTTIYQGINILDLILTFVIIICFWLGMRAIRCSLTEQIENRAAGWLLLWYVVLFLLAFLQLGNVLGLAMFVLYFVIFYKLFKLSAQIDANGYQVQNTATIRSERYFAGMVSIILVLCIGIGYLCFHQYPMEWQEISKETQMTQFDNKIYQHLKLLGVDEYVLQDLSAEDLALCKDAIRVHVEKESSISSLNNEYEQDVLTLNFTHVAIELPSENENAVWRIIHHFQWSEPLDFYGTEGMKLWQTYLTRDENWIKFSEITGQALYDSDGKTYYAPYYSIYEDNYEVDTVFWGEQTHNDSFVAFSYPKGGETYRGYVTYAAKELVSTSTIASWVNYAHCRSAVSYPVRTAVDFLKATNGKTDFFYTQQALQFYPPEIE